MARITSPESGLYPTVKGFLSERGYDAKGEVCGCDVVATGPGGILAIVELKIAVSLELLLQGVDRIGCADEVWLAVQASGRGRVRDGRVRKLCRLLGFGLLAVRGPAVEVLAEPEPYRPRANLRRRGALTAEHAARRGDPSPGGTRGVPIMTAYRQQALDCAALMQEGPQRPRDLRQVAPRAAAILKRNVYGWFQRVERGVYALTPDGEAAVLGHEPPA